MTTRDNLGTDAGSRHDAVAANAATMQRQWALELITPKVITPAEIEHQEIERRMAR